MSILVTGGAGFIGSNFVLDWLAQGDEPVINLDNLAYAGNRHNLDGLKAVSYTQLRGRWRRASCAVSSRSRACRSCCSAPA